MARSSSGSLVPDPNKWPNGIKAVADQIHGLGLKFGLYGCAGTKTCAGYPGSQGYETKDAQTLAAWGVDYWKYVEVTSSLALPPDRASQARQLLHAVQQRSTTNVREPLWQYHNMVRQDARRARLRPKPKAHLLLPLPMGTRQRMAMGCAIRQRVAYVGRRMERLGVRRPRWFRRCGDLSVFGALWFQRLGYASDWQRGVERGGVEDAAWNLGDQQVAAHHWD
jgi:hypothetical protein